MPSTDVLFKFLIAACVFAYMPGPAMLYTVAQTVAHGRKAGWMTALGIHLGGYVHVIAAALGLAVVLSVFPVLFTMIKLAGAGYLIWLGLVMYRESGSLTSAAVVSDQGAYSSSTFWQSVGVEVLNPKTAIFYIAFLPQFTDPAAQMALWLQLLLLGTFVNFLFSSADLICVLLSSTVVKWLSKSARANMISQRLGASILIGLGIHLAFSRQ